MHGFTIVFVSIDFELLDSFQNVFALCIAVFVFSFEKGLLSTVFKQKSFALMGRLSYSIYMVHAAVLFVIISAFMVLQKVLHIELALVIEGTRYINLGNGILNNLLVVVILCVVVVVSLLTYKFIEQPGQRLGKRLNGQSK